jgi:hypothetical protein
MEQLALVASVCSLPSVLFILIASMNGGNKILGYIFLKLPAFITLVALVIMALKAFKFI